LARIALILGMLVAARSVRADPQASSTHRLVIVEPTPPLGAREPVRWRAGPVDLDAGAVVQLDASRGGDHPGFFLQSSRLRFGARLERTISLGLRLQVEANPLAESPGLLDAVIDFRVASRGLADLGHLELGQMRVPLSRARLAEPEDRPFVALPLGARALAPDRDIGVLYSLALPGSREPAFVRLGLFNGEGANAPGGGGSVVLARIEGEVGDPSRARAGGSWGVAAQRSSDAASASGSGPATTLEVDLQLHYRALQAGAEVLWKGDQARAAWTWAGYDVIPDTLELLARLETFDDGTVTRRLTVGATFYYLSQRFRLLFNTTVPIAPQRDAAIEHVASFLAVL
jgi:hypothetical protein